MVRIPIFLSVVAAALLLWILFSGEIARAWESDANESQVEFNHWSLAFVETASSGGGSGSDVRLTSNGNVVIAGWNSGPDTVKAWVTLMEPAGSVIWQKEYEAGGANTFAFSIRETADSGFIVAGRADFKPWVLKIAADGSVEWQKEFSITGDLQMAIEIAGGEFLAVGRKDNDYWAARLDAGGNLVWQKSYSRAGGGDFETATAVLEAGDGGFVISGYGGSPSSTWIIKIDEDGDITWQTHLSADSTPYQAGDLIRTSDGNFVAAGSANETAPADSDFWVVKLDQTGAVLWQKSIDVTSKDHGEAIAELPNGDLVLVGSIEVAESQPGAYMARLDAAGNPIWQKVHPVGIGSGFHSVAPGPEGDILAAGYANGQSNSLSGIWAIRLGSDGEITDCLLIQDAAGNAGNASAAASNTAVNPVVTTAIPSTPPLAVFNVNLKLEVFCSVYTKPANDDFWALNFGRYADNDFDFYTSAIALTSDGNYLVAGGFNPHDTGDDHAWAMKLGPDGEIRWQISMGNGEDDDFNAVALDPDDNAYLAGYTDDGDDTNGLLAKVDPDGNLLWLKSYGGNGGESFGEIARLPNGDLVMLGGTTSSGMGLGDFWLVKVDSTGNLIWEYTFGGSSFEYSRDLALADNGDILIAGLTNSYGAGGFDIWVLRLDSNANILWQKTFGGSDTDYVESVIEASNGDIVIAGKTYNAGVGLGDAWVLRLASSGSSIWQKTLGTSHEDTAYRVIELNDGGLLIAGSVVADQDPFADSDGWLIHLSSIGTVDWEYAIGGLGSEDLYDLIVDPEGNIIAAGFSRSPGIEDEGVPKAFLVKFDPAGLVCDCLAQIAISTEPGTTTIPGQNTLAVRQTANSSTASPTIAMLSVVAELNALCRLIPIDGPTPTPTPTTGPPTPTPTATATPPGLDFRIYLPVIIR